jgi:hypothetical protein
VNWTRILAEAGIPEPPGRQRVIEQLLKAGAVNELQVQDYEAAKVQEQAERLQKQAARSQPKPFRSKVRIGA